MSERMSTPAESPRRPTGILDAARLADGARRRGPDPDRVA